MRKIRYPTRCRIVDVSNVEVFPGVIGNTPGISKPHVGKTGTARLHKDGNVKIILDDKTVLWGYECWWVPIEKSQSKEMQA